MSTHRLEYASEGFVGDTILEWNVYCIALPSTPPSIVQRTRSGEVLAELVERASHDPIRRVKCFFDTITVVTVNVNVEHARYRAQKFENGEDNIVDVAEARRFSFLRVM